MGATRAVALGRRGWGQPLGRVRSVLAPWSADVARRGGGPTWRPEEQPQPSGELFLHWLMDWTGLVAVAPVLVAPAPSFSESGGGGSSPPVSH